MDIKKISAVVALILMVSGGIAGAWRYDRNIVKRYEFDLLSQRLEQKIISDRANDLQKRIWNLEDRYGGPGVPGATQVIKDEYRKLILELKEIQKGE